MYKSKYQSSVMGALLLVLILTVSAYASPFTAPKKLADYLYYMEYNDYVPDLATSKISNRALRAPLCTTEISMAVI